MLVASRHVIVPVDGSWSMGRYCEAKHLSRMIEDAGRHGICCAGNWIIDRVKIISAWPRQDELAMILAEETGTGGSPYNVLMDLARFQLGLALYGVGLVGDDADGRYILDDCARNGIDARGVQQAPGVATAYTDVMTVKATGRRTFFHCRGANARLAPEHVAIDEIPSRIFLLGYLLLLDALDEEDADYGTRAARVLAGLQEAGVATAIDLVSEDSDRFPKVVHPALRYTDYCIINEIEAGRTVGLELRNGEQLDESAVEVAAAKLLELGVGRLVVIHAPELSVALSTDGQLDRQASHRLPEGYIQGTAGAGDAFMAGMLVGIHEGWETGRALRFATAAAASCLRHPTTTGGVGSAEEIWKLAETLDYR